MFMRLVLSSLFIGVLLVVGCGESIPTATPIPTVTPTFTPTPTSTSTVTPTPSPTPTATPTPVPVPQAIAAAAAEYYQAIADRNWELAYNRTSNEYRASCALQCFTQVAKLTVQALHIPEGVRLTYEIVSIDVEGDTARVVKELRYNGIQLVAPTEEQPDVWMQEDGEWHIAD